MKKFLAYAAARFREYDTCQLGVKNFISMACSIILGSALIFVLISKQSFT
jgi:hypothetical protein